MGYGMYTLVLPFFAWMIVLVVSAIHGQLPFAEKACMQLIVPIDYGVAVQGVYSNGYIQIDNSVKPSTAAIYANELNLYNLEVALAAQRLVLSSTNASIAAQRVT